MLQLPINFTIEIVPQLLDRQLQLNYNNEDIKQCREDFLQYMKDCTVPIYGLNTLLGSKNGQIIQNIQEYEKTQLSKLFHSHFEKNLSQNLTRITLFVLINNICSEKCGISIECLNELINLFYNSDKIQLQGENYNSQYYDATLNWNIIRLIKNIQIYDAIILTQIKSVSQASLLYFTYQGIECIRTAYTATAISFEASNGVICAYTDLVNEVKQHEGQLEVAQELYNLLTENGETSDLNQSLKLITHNILQDAYSLRCTPQVLGASLDQIRMISKQLQNKIGVFGYNFVYKNNKIIEIEYLEQQNNEQEVVLMDYLSIAISEIGAIAERRIQRLMHPKLNKLQNYYLDFLAASDQEYGLQQLCNWASNFIQKNKRHCQPISSDSMPQTTFFEDINNMIEESINKLENIIHNTIYILGIDMFISSRVIKKLEEKEKQLSNDKLQTLINQVLKYENVRELVYEKLIK